MAIEEPNYTVSIRDGACEVRTYPPLIAAEVTVTGDREQAINAGFRLLAGYIFGDNIKKQKIAMTAPVVQAPVASEKIAMTAPVMQQGEGNDWTVRFMMPKSYSLESLPTPTNSKVRLVALPSAKLAVVRFSGLTQDGDIEKQTKILKDYTYAHQLKTTGVITIARYDPPWTLWFMRRNELMIALA